MKTNFHMKGWAPRLALKKRPKVIRKWSIAVIRTTQEHKMNKCMSKGNAPPPPKGDNWVAMWRLGAWAQPGASTIASKLQEGDGSHGFQIHTSQLWTNTARERSRPVRLITSVEKRGSRKRGTLNQRMELDNPTFLKAEIKKWSSQSLDKKAQLKALFKRYTSKIPKTHGILVTADPNDRSSFAYSFYGIYNVNFETQCAITSGHMCDSWGYSWSKWQSWKTSAHACSWLFLARFRSLDQWKFTPLNNVVVAGDFLAITTFDNLHERMETLKISVNTLCVESCTKTKFSEVVHPQNFSKNNFPLL